MESRRSRGSLDRVTIRSLNVVPVVDDLAPNEPELVPVSMLAAFEFCPRLFFLQWVDAQHATNAAVAHGNWVHRRADERAGAVHEPSPGGGGATPLRARSVEISSPALGLVARIDVLEGDAGGVVPVELKSGAPPETGGAWPSDRLQLCAQGLLLRDAGYRCDGGFVYYDRSRDRVPVVFDDELVAAAFRTLADLRAVARQGLPPSPLVDSPKCPGCSLVGICLPDELNALNGRHEGPPRKILPADPDPCPVYVTDHRATIGKRADRLEVRVAGAKVTDARLLDVSQVCVFGNAQVSTQLLAELFARSIPVCFFSSGGWFRGIAHGMEGRNVELRRRQVIVAAQGGLDIARRIVAAKIANSRVLLRRNARPRPEVELARLTRSAQGALEAETIAELLGIEGAAARTYFQALPAMLRPLGSLPGGAFTFEGRNRRPPLDPVNCLLSYLYSLLTKDMTVTTFAIGFDPYIGFYHQPRFGRPALALDLVEEFRSVIADSIAITLVNTGEIRASDFIVRSTGVALTNDGRRTVLRAYERRLGTEVQHPRFGYTVTYRRVLDVQARMLAAHLLGEVDSYQPFTTR